MKRRIQTKSKKTSNDKRKISSGVKLASAKKFFSNPSGKAVNKDLKMKWHKENLRFGISLIVLTALLEAALFMFLLVLNSSTGVAQGQIKTNAMSNQIALGQKKTVSPTSRILQDENLDFEITVPKEFGDWVYKTGSIKSLIDDKLADEYLQIYVPLSANSDSNKFEGRYQNILTVMRFTEDEWDEISQGCEKSNLYYCDAKGTELGRKEQYVYSYTEPINCPKEVEFRCGKANRITESFKIK
jgi:hypothetical protein